MDELSTLTYEVDGRIARITLDRPERGNGITLEMPRELAACVERADLDPEVHVDRAVRQRHGLLRRLRPRRLGRGDDASGFGVGAAPRGLAARSRRSRRANHDPDGTWDPVSTTR